MSGVLDLVLIGNRPGALHAASRLGLGVLLVDETPPSAAARRRIDRFFEAPLEGGEEALLAGVRDALGETVPRAVFAAGERGVLAAASVRSAYGLGGVGPGVARLARDKPSMKTAVRSAGIRCADWQALGAGTDASALVAALGLPLIVKRRTASGTRGLFVARTTDDAERGLAAIPTDERASWVAERFVDGVEMSVESFISGGEILFVNPTEYLVPAFASIAPATLAEDDATAIFALNAAVIRALGIERGMTHLELFRTGTGPVFGEVAVRPPGGRLMRLIRRAYGFDPWETALRLELGEHPADLPVRALRAAGVWMLHPGAGRVRSVRGLAAARRVLGVRKLVCRVRAGSVVRPRIGTGIDVGWLEVWGRDRDQVAARIQRAHELVQIEMEPSSAGT